MFTFLMFTHNDPMMGTPALNSSINGKENRSVFLEPFLLKMYTILS